MRKSKERREAQTVRLGPHQTASFCHCTRERQHGVGRSAELPHRKSCAAPSGVKLDKSVHRNTKQVRTGWDRGYQRHSSYGIAWHRGRRIARQVLRRCRVRFLLSQLRLRRLHLNSSFQYMSVARAIFLTRLGRGRTGLIAGSRGAVEGYPSRANCV